ncbi:MAG TPA: glycosyltransferase, partial [Steroidobacteraceae bacterium]|nr:glycosyltransferase [Steroidobacteraceae bacterium]
MARTAAGERREAAYAHDEAAQRPQPSLPHVCFVAPYAWPVFARDARIKVVGGAEVQQSILMRLLRGNGYRVSLVTLDFGQPQRALVEGVTVYKTYRMDEGIPVLRFLHPRLTSVWQALREADADIYYQRSADVLTAVVAQYCRSHGRRSIYASASDRDFERGREQVRYARDRWLYERGLMQVDRIVVENELQLATLRRHYRRDATLIPSCYEPPSRARAGG